MLLFRCLLLAAIMRLLHAAVHVFHRRLRSGLTCHFHRTETRLQRLRYKKQNEQAGDKLHVRILGY
jgi:hypothetical protein